MLMSSSFEISVILPDKVGRDDDSFCGRCSVIDSLIRPDSLLDWPQEEGYGFT